MFESNFFIFFDQMHYKRLISRERLHMKVSCSRTRKQRKVGDKVCKDAIIDVRRLGDRIISIKLVLELEIVHVISTTKGLWDSLEELVHKFPPFDKFFLGGDLNGHVGKDWVRYERIHGGQGFGSRARVAQGYVRLRIKWWNLKGDMCQKFRNRILGSQSVIEGWEIFEVEDMISSTELYDYLENHIRRGANEVLGEAKERGGHDKETWYSKGVWEAKKRMYDDLYNRLGTKEGDNDIFKIAKARERKTSDLSHVKHCVFRLKVNAKEVGEALKRMKLGKAIGLDDIPIEAWKCLGERRLRSLTTVSKNQYGFMPGRQVIERYREDHKSLRMAFIDLNKAYDRIPGMPQCYVDIIKDMYEGVATSVCSIGGMPNEFPISIGLHQGSTLIPYLFALVMNELTRHHQDDKHPIYISIQKNYL
ncbi:hypothetical protein UlMin_010355 [Ulmus minor]